MGHDDHQGSVRALFLDPLGCQCATRAFVDSVRHAFVQGKKQTAMFVAARSGDLAIAEALIKRGATMGLQVCSDVI
jgi:hypothetical protein